MEIFKIEQEIKELRKAKELLDEILSYYSIYDKQFEVIYKSEEDELNNKIRHYCKFDDSE